ncbi:MAG TPA: hypothetical protein VMC81_04345 [Rhodocyclaceae bacterium]|nr:hypothetical protein [Rhodocyclaceae bacterium]
MSVSESGRHIVIKVLVPMTSELGMRAGPDAARLGAERKLSAYLFDLRDSPNVQSVIDNYEFVHKDIPKSDFPRDSRNAFLVRPDDKSHEFISMVFANAGYMTKTFTDEASAVAWLETDSPSAATGGGWHKRFP